MTEPTVQATDRAVTRALRFRTCPDCEYDLATGEGDRSCHYGACPNLPEMLDIHCPRCWYNFFTGEGRAECGDPPTCDFATREAPIRTSALARWLEER
ncbi:MAG: hypothetical protein R3320_00580 [Nitriliruptorales bacterium]|nr:hypothetical protein [Nitriliruptorales bacterium]